MVSRVSEVHLHYMSTAGSDVDGETNLSHLSHEPGNRNNEPKSLLHPTKWNTVE